MPKIINKNDLVDGVNLVIDKVNYTIELIPVNGLTEKYGVDFQAFYSKLVDLWNTVTYQTTDMPVYCVDVLSGKYRIGTNGSTYNAWKLKNQATRNMLRDGGLTQYNLDGSVAREDVCIRVQGGINSWAQLYYQLEVNGEAIDFPFTGSPNILIQVFGDVSNGNFDKRSYFKVYCREQGRVFKESTLIDIGRSSTGGWITEFFIDNPFDSKIVAQDNEMSNTPYNNITITSTTNQNKQIGSGFYPFNLVINGNGASLEQIYTKINYLLRQSSDIDSNPANTILGKTSPLFTFFDDNVLVTHQGSYIENPLSTEIGRIRLTDVDGIELTLITINFNANLVAPNAVYKVLFNNLPNTLNNFGSLTALVIRNTDGVPISGSIGIPQLSIVIDYGSNQGGHIPGTSIGYTAIATSPNTGLYAMESGVIDRNKVNTINLTSTRSLGS